MCPIEVAFWAEGPTDRSAARKLIRTVGAFPGPDYSSRRGAASGKDYLDRNLARFNEAARYSPWFVLRDADGDCAVDLVASLLPNPAPKMCFRVVVPAIEAWLMADREALAQHLSVATNRIPEAPEGIANAKQRLLEIVQHSRSRSVREDYLPIPRSGRREGPGYASGLIEFIEKHWNPVRASKHANNLQRCINRLRELVCRV